MKSQCNLHLYVATLPVWCAAEKVDGAYKHRWRLFYWSCCTRSLWPGRQVGVS